MSVTRGVVSLILKVKGNEAAVRRRMEAVVENMAAFQLGRTDIFDAGRACRVENGLDLRPEAAVPLETRKPLEAELLEEFSGATIAPAAGPEL